MRACGMISAILGVVLCGSALSGEGPTNAVWCMPRGDSRQAGVAGADLGLPLKPAWRVDVGMQPVAAPTVGATNVFAVMPGGRVLALGVDGRPGFDVTFEGLTLTGAALLGSGLLYLADEEGVVLAVDAADGRERWRRATGFGLRAGPRGGTGGPKREAAVFVMDQSDGRLVGLRADDGTPLWTREATTRCDGGMSVAGSMGAYGNCDAGVHIVDLSSGEALGFAGLGEQSQMAGDLALRGGVAFGGTRDGRLVAVRMGTEAKPVWERSVADAELFATPAVDARHVVAAAHDGTVALLETGTGGEVWSVTLASAASSPILTPGQVVTTVDGSLVVLSRKDGRVLGRYELGDETTPIGVGAGRFVVGTDTGEMVCF